MSAAQFFTPYPDVDMTNVNGDQRKAALLLHNMPAIDRDWLLERLPTAQRETLQILLTELTRLGIPVDRSLLDEVIDIQGHAVPTPGVQMQTVRELFAVDANLVVAVLKDEPAVLIAHLLLIQDWPWSDILLESLEVFKRRQIEKTLLVLRKKTAVNDGANGQVLFEKLHQRLVSALQMRLDLCDIDWRRGGQLEKRDGLTERPTPHWLVNIATQCRDMLMKRRKVPA